MRRTRLTVGMTLAVGALVIGIIAFGPALKSFAMRKVVGSVPGGYFAPYLGSEPQLVGVAPGIWWFNTDYTRSLIADTGEGLLVFDCFNAEHAAAMKAAIERDLAGKVSSTRIRALVYSHHHFDHIRGGAALEPESVIADDDVAAHLTEGWRVGDILPPNVSLSAPGALQIGSVDVQAVDLGNGHGDRLWAFYFPSQKLLYAPDLAFVRTLPPFNLPDTNYVGLQKQFERALALPFESWVPSHFRISMDGQPVATRADLIDYQMMMKDIQVWTREGFERFGVPVTSVKAEEVFGYVQQHADEKYGEWEGYDSMAVPLMLQYLAATYLGY